MLTCYPRSRLSPSKQKTSLGDGISDRLQALDRRITLRLVARYRWHFVRWWTDKQGLLDEETLEMDRMQLI